MRFRIPTILWVLFLCTSVNVHAQPTGRVSGRVLDQTGAALPGVAIDLVVNSRELTAVTDDTGTYRFDAVPPGNAELTFRLLNFSVLRRSVSVTNGAAGERRRRVDALAQRRRHRDGSPNVSQRRRRREPGGEPRRHRGIGEPGRRDRRADRRASDHAHRRSPRDRAGPDREPAQRRGQGESVLPARLQPRSRHRLLDDGRRSSGEYANRRARPWLFGRQLPDSRARERRAVQEGAVLRGRGRLLGGGCRQHQLRQSARTSDRSASAAATTDGDACSVPPRRASAAGICSARSR